MTEGEPQRARKGTRRRRISGGAAGDVRGSPSGALRDVLERADLLPEAELLDLYERLAAELEGQPVGEGRRDRRLRERADALRALRSARDELGLADDQPLTSRAFNEVCQYRVAGWNAGRVIRAWGTWRNAADVFAGATPPRRAEREAVTLVRGFRRSSHRPPLDGLLAWLATDPTAEGMHAYDRWARARNAELEPDEQRYMGSGGVAFAMETTFAVARRRAEAILADEPIPADEQQDVALAKYEAAGHELVTFASFARTVGLSQKQLRSGVRRTPLPPPVLRHGHRTFWLASDCELWLDDKTVQRPEGELDALVLDQRRLAQRLNTKLATIHSRYLHAPHRLPPLAGLIGDQPWWDPAAVERWQCAPSNGSQRRPRQEDTVCEVDGRELIARRGVCELLGISRGTFHRHLQERPLPVALVLSGTALWLREDIEAWAANKTVKRIDGELNGLLLGLDEIATRLGMSYHAVRLGLARGGDRYPQPDGVINNHAFWKAADFERWLAEHPDRD